MIFGQLPEWTPSQMNTIPIVHHPKWTPSRVHTIRNGCNPEWTQSLMDRSLKFTQSINIYLVEDLVKDFLSLFI